MRADVRVSGHRLTLGRSAEEVKAFVDSFAAIGVDEVIFNPATDDVDEVDRLAGIVL